MILSPDDDDIDDHYVDNDDDDDDYDEVGDHDNTPWLLVLWLY